MENWSTSGVGKVSGADGQIGSPQQHSREKEVDGGGQLEGVGGERNWRASQLWRCCREGESINQLGECVSDM